eukprot:m.97503 g.97503  ORF g.97503 m.97503 type:complete len:450 (-) comp26982_c0_seq5:41-1390(-)
MGPRTTQPKSSEYCATCCGASCDSVFAYQTQKIVTIKDRRLGILKILFMVVITMYISFNIIYNCKYLNLEAPFGTVRFSLREPTIDECDPVKTDGCRIDNSRLTPVDTYEYCSQNPNTNFPENLTKPCVFWDAIEAKHVQDRSVLLTTMFQAMTQTRQNCSLNPTPKQNCSQLWQNDENVTFNYVAGIENFTLLVDHVVETPTLGLGSSATAMAGKLLVQHDSTVCVAQKGQDIHGQRTNNAPCFVTPQISNGFDYFDILTLLRAGDLDGKEIYLDDLGYKHKPYRQNGGVLLLTISYSNWLHWSGPYDWSNFPTITSRPITYTYSAKLMSDSKYKYETTAYPTRDTRLVKTLYGLRIVVLQGGTLGKFDVSVLIVQLTTSLGMLAVATIIVDLLATRVLRMRNFYRSSKYQESGVTDVNEVKMDKFQDTTTIQDSDEYSDDDKLIKAL